MMPIFDMTLGDYIEAFHPLPIPDGALAKFGSQLLNACCALATVSNPLA